MYAPTAETATRAVMMNERVATVLRSSTARTGNTKTPAGISV